MRLLLMTHSHKFPQKDEENKLPCELSLLLLSSSSSSRILIEFHGGKQKRKDYLKKKKKVSEPLERRKDVRFLLHTESYLQVTLLKQRGRLKQTKPCAPGDSRALVPGKHRAAAVWGTAAATGPPGSRASSRLARSPGPTS